MYILFYVQKKEKVLRYFIYYGGEKTAQVCPIHKSLKDSSVFIKGPPNAKWASCRDCKKLIQIEERRYPKHRCKKASTERTRHITEH